MASETIIVEATTVATDIYIFVEVRCGEFWQSWSRGGIEQERDSTLYLAIEECIPPFRGLPLDASTDVLDKYYATVDDQLMNCIGKSNWDDSNGSTFIGELLFCTEDWATRNEYTVKLVRGKLRAERGFFKEGWMDAREAEMVLKAYKKKRKEFARDAKKAYKLDGKVFKALADTCQNYEAVVSAVKMLGGRIVFWVGN